MYMTSPKKLKKQLKFLLVKKFKCLREYQKKHDLPYLPHGSLENAAVNERLQAQMSHLEKLLENK